MRNGHFDLPDDASTVCPGELSIPWQMGAYRAADTNGDGKLDWLAITWDANSNTGSLFDVPSPNANGGGRHFQRADVNGDGRDDWVSVGFANPGVEVYTAMTQPDGTFLRTHAIFSPGSLGEASRVDGVRQWFAADVGGPGGVPDGKTDIVVLDDVTHMAITLLADGNGGWTETVYPHNMPIPPHRWLAVDLDGDGRTDFVNVHATTINGAPGVEVSSLMSHGDGTWGTNNNRDFAGTIGTANIPRVRADRLRRRWLH